jgi:biopolymer transport protein ExbD
VRRRRLSSDERAYIDVVPLVDTLLAVFLFLAVLAFQSPITLLAVKLPFAKEGEKEQITQVLRVQVLRNGEYLHEGKRATLEDLAGLLKKKSQKG